MFSHSHICQEKTTLTLAKGLNARIWGSHTPVFNFGCNPDPLSLGTSSYPSKPRFYSYWDDQT